MKVIELREVISADGIVILNNYNDFETFIREKDSKNNEYVALVDDISMWDKHGESEIEQIYADDDEVCIDIK